MATYKVWYLDVWGHVESDPKDCDCTNECPGYTVNDRNPYNRTVELNDMSDAGIIAACVEADFLASDCTTETIEIECSEHDFIEINRKYDGRYLLQLESV